MADATPDAVLERFVGLMMEDPAPRPWERLFPHNDHSRVRITYFLLHRDEIDLQEFVTTTLERILHELLCRTERETTEYRGRVRGKVIWPATLKSRYTGDFDPTRFVCRNVHRLFDTPENQLLRFLVEKIWRGLQVVPPVMQTGRCYYPASGETGSETIGQRLQAMQDRLSALRRHVRLRQIGVPDHISVEHIRCAEAARREEYGLAVRVYRRYRAAILDRSWNQIIGFSRGMLALPGRVDAEGEPWLHFASAVVRAPLSDRHL